MYKLKIFCDAFISEFWTSSVRQRNPFYNEYELQNRKTGKLYTDRIAFHMIELPKLKDATEEEKKTKLYQWSCLFVADSREK